MEKHTWHRITTPKSTKEPSPRWGHCVATREHELIYFAGYADSVYMNDLWVFNTQTMTWNDIKTGGEVPSNRSNCTAHFDSAGDELIVFGGGGTNKKRFNTVSILNWKTKIWRQIHPNSNESAPWQRTYHSSVLLSHYLVVFGGEGIADLDDLWIFDLRNSSWKEVKIGEEKSKPSARRFHTSVLIGNSFYVIAGCYAKYRSLSDIWKIDLTSLVQAGETDNLEWQEVKIKGSSFLTRWGHTSVVFDEKIYVFGGRFCNDLQDIIIIDPTKDIIKSMRVSGNTPKARRRHACAFIGGCMITFGGFNGQYFNDLSYINVFDARPKSFIAQSVLEETLPKWVNRQYLSDAEVKCKGGKSFKIHKGMLVTHFKNQFVLERFLSFIEEKYEKEQLQNIIQTLYLGYGTLPSEIYDNFDIILFQSLLQKANSIRKMIDPLSSELLSLSSRSKCEVYYLNQQKYQEYLERFHQNMHYDMLFVVGQDCIPVNKTLIAANGPYLECLLRDLEEDTLDFKFYHSFGDSRVFQVLMCYLQTGILVVPEGIDEQCWMLMHQLADYMCLSSLMSLCQNQMLQLLNQTNCNEILRYAAENNLSVLSMGSAQMVVSTLLDKNKENILKSLTSKQKMTSSDQLVSKYIEISKFDLAQRFRRQQIVDTGLIKRPSENNIEKENENEIMQ